MTLSVKKQDKFFKFGDFCTLGKNSIRSFPSFLRGRKEEEEAGLCWGYGSIYTTHRRRRRTKDFAEKRRKTYFRPCGIILFILMFLLSFQIITLEGERTWKMKLFSRHHLLGDTPFF